MSLMTGPGELPARGPARIDAAVYTEVQNLYAFYNLASDDGNAEAYAGCFTSDGALEIPSIGLHIKGYAALVAFKEADRARRGQRLRRHWNSGLYLESVDDHTVRGQCYLHGYNAAPGEVPVLADVGRYNDEVVRVDGVWRFAHRLITLESSAFTPPQ